MLVEVWADVACPWCYLGKRRLEQALSQFPHADQVSVRWRSFQLDPAHPTGMRTKVYDYLADKYGGTAAQARAMTGQVAALGAAEGLAYDFDRAQVVNTFDAHRVIHLAAAHGVGAEAFERLMHAQHVDGEAVDDPQTLIRLAAQVGVPEQETGRVLAGDDFAADVREDIRQASRLGATGVPFFVLDRAYGLAGAQPVETFLAALRQAYDHAGASAG